MPHMGFEPTIPVFEREKTFHALDHAATVIGKYGPDYTKSSQKAVAFSDKVVRFTDPPGGNTSTCYNKSSKSVDSHSEATLTELRFVRYTATS
jgi:hypothetical protein